MSNEDNSRNRNRLVDRMSHALRVMMMDSGQPEETSDFNQTYPNLEIEYGIKGAIYGKGNMTNDGSILFRLPTTAAEGLKHNRLITDEDVKSSKKKKSKFDGIND